MVNVSHSTICLITNNGRPEEFRAATFALFEHLDNTNSKFFRFQFERNSFIVVLFHGQLTKLF